MGVKEGIHLAIKGVGIAAILIAGFVVLSSKVNASAGINQQLSFEGKIVDAGGQNIPDGTYNMEFKIYQDGNSSGSGGNLKWTEDRLRNNSQGVTFTSGTFQVNLGAVNAFGSSVDWNQDTLWLSLNVGSTNATCTPFSSCSPDGEMTPFIRLTSTPYAMNADKLDGIDSSGFVQLSPSGQQSGNVNISGTISSGAVNGINIGSTIQPSSAGGLTVSSNGSNAITLTGGAASTWSTTSGLLTVQGAGGVAIGSAAGSTSSSASLKSGDASSGAAGDVTIDTGTFTSGTPTVNIGHTNAAAINIGNTTSATTTLIQGGGTGGVSAQTGSGGTVSIGTTAQNGTVTIGTTSTNTGNTQTINVGNLNAAGTTNVNIGTGSSATAGTTSVLGKTAVTITAGGASTWSTSSGLLSLQGAGGATVSSSAGSTSSAVTLQSGNASGGASGNASVDTGSFTSGTPTVNVGHTNAAAVFVGNTTAATSTTFQGGTGASAIVVQAGSGGTLAFGASGVANTINVGNNGASNAVAQGINIGTNSNAGATNTVVIGNTAATASTVAINGGTGANAIALTTGTNGTIAANAGGNGNITLTTNSASSGTLSKSATNSTVAFQLQNSSGATIFNVDTTASLASANLLANPSFETTISGSGAGVWVIKQGGAGVPTIANNTSQFYNQLNSAKVVTTATANDGIKQQLSTTLSASTAYNVIFYAKLDVASASMATLQAGYSDTGASDDQTCALSQTLVATGWTKYTCTFTTGSGGSAPTSSNYFYVKQTDAAIHTFYVDAVLLQLASSADANYRDAKISLNGVITSPIIVQNASNSTNALTIQNADGGQVFNVDTTDSNLINNPSNPSFEVNTSGWALRNGASGTTTIARDTSQQKYGLASLKITADAHSGNGARYTLASGSWPAGSYTVSFSMFNQGTAFAAVPTVLFGNGSDNACAAVTPSTVPSTNAWTRYSSACTFSGSTTSIVIAQNEATAHTFYIDAAQLESGNTATAYGLGAISLSGQIISPTTFRNQSDSNVAFQIQNAASATIFVVDNLNNIIKIGDNTGTDTATTLLVVDSSTADPSTNLSLKNGGIFYNSTSTSLKAVENGAVGTLGSWKFLGNFSLGSGAVDLTSGTIRVMKVYMINYRIAGYSASCIARFQFGTAGAADTGANYSQSVSTSSAASTNTASTNGINVSTVAQAGARPRYGTVTIYNYNGVTKRAVGQGVSTPGDTAATIPTMDQFAGFYSNTSQINFIDLNAGTSTAGGAACGGNLSSGTEFSIWGANDN